MENVVGNPILSALRTAVDTPFGAAMASAHGTAQSGSVEVDGQLYPIATYKSGVIFSTFQPIAPTP